MQKKASLFRLKRSICLLFGQTVSLFWLFFSPYNSAHAISCNRYFEIQHQSEYLSSVEFWSHFQFAYDSNFNANFKENRSFYNRFLQHSDHVKMLETFFGYDFRLRHPNQNTIEDALNAYEFVMRMHVSRGVIKDYLKLVFAFKNQITSEVKYIPFGDLIPEGFIPYRTLLSRKDFFRAIANGYFVIGFPVSTNLKSYNTVVDHDFAHITTFMQHPVIVPEISRLAKEYKGLDKDESHNDFPLYLPFEVWNYISKGSAEQMKKFVGGIVPKRDSFVSTEEIIRNLSHLSESSFYKFFDDLLNHQDKWVQYAGGSFRDIVTKMNILIDVNRGFYSVENDNAFLRDTQYLSKLIMYQSARAILRSRARSEAFSVPTNFIGTNFRAVDMQIAANILAIMDGLSKITILDAYKSFSEEGFVPGSVLDRMYREINIKNIDQEIK